MSTPSYVSMSLHTVGLVSFTTSFHYLFTARKGGVADGFGGHFQFITNIALLLSTLTFVSALAHDLSSLVAVDRSTRVLRCLATPLELVITLSYWTVLGFSHLLYADGRLLTRRVMPLGWDVSFHLLPAVYLLGDYVVRPPERELCMDSGAAFALFVLATTVYNQWLTFCAERNGAWAYPLFERFVGGSVGRGLVWVAVAGVMEVFRAWILRWSCVD